MKKKRGDSSKKLLVLGWSAWMPRIMLQSALEKCKSPIIESQRMFFWKSSLSSWSLTALANSECQYRFLWSRTSFPLPYFLPFQFWYFISEVCLRPLSTAHQIPLCNSDVYCSASISSTALARSGDSMEHISNTDKMSSSIKSARVYIGRRSGLTYVSLCKSSSTYVNSHKFTYIT